MTLIEIGKRGEEGIEVGKIVMVEIINLVLERFIFFFNVFVYF